MRGACHCGAVRFEIAAPPTWVLDCNCTICRRYGAMWSYLRGEAHVDVTTPPTPGATEAYAWNGKGLGFHRCKACGCVTHLEVNEDPTWIYAINARMLLGLDPAAVTIRHVDNGHSGFFWTVSTQPDIVAKQPPMPPAGPDDWR